MTNTLKVLNLEAGEFFTIPEGKTWYNQGTGDIAIEGQVFNGPFWGAFYEFEGDLQVGEMLPPPPPEPVLWMYR